jgi:hypothetical protein
VGSNPTGGHGCLSVCFVCFQVEVSATGRSLVHRNPTDCGASLCVVCKPRERGGPGPLELAPQKMIIQINISPIKEVPRYFKKHYSLNLKLSELQSSHYGNLSTGPLGNYLGSLGIRGPHFGNHWLTSDSALRHQGMPCCLSVCCTSSRSEGEQQIASLFSSHVNWAVEVCSMRWPCKCFRVCETRAPRVFVSIGLLQEVGQGFRKLDGRDAVTNAAYCEIWGAHNSFAEDRRASRWRRFEVSQYLHLQGRALNKRRLKCLAL